MQPTTAVVAPVLLGIVAFVVFRHLLVRLLWGPITQPDDHQEKCRAGGNRVSSDGHSPSGIVRVIRLTDDGEFADRCELTDVLYEIRNPKKSELVVWYIHGWKHNAADRDSDLRAFRSLVNALRASSSSSARTDATLSASTSGGMARLARGFCGR